MNHLREKRIKMRKNQNWRQSIQSTKWFQQRITKKENERMDRIKEIHDDQMAATNRFINIFEKCMKNGDS